MTGERIEYAGLPRRLAAALVDVLLLVIVLTPLTYFFNQGDPLHDLDSESAMVEVGFDWGALLIHDLLPMVLVVFFWVRYRGTPGKHLMNCQVVDATSFGNLRVGQAVLRYVGYFISLLPLGLGFFWIIRDKKKRGFHDLIAHSVVIHQPINHIAAIEADKSLEQRLKEVR